MPVCGAVKITNITHIPLIGGLTNRDKPSLGPIYATR